MQYLISLTLLLTAAAVNTNGAAAAERPNILWITSEDNGPHLGCYGDTYADTPNIDALASRGTIYLNCWSTAPVCAPARTTLISGLYPPSTGSEHMRSMAKLPANFRMYPQYLRDAGYYCTNNSKEDYNLQKQSKVWDESSRKAHWKNRKPGQPFFAIFNHTISHESRLRSRPHKQIHDPAKVRIPAYHPDTPEVRRDWAQYYDKLTEMDARVGKNLKELADAGLADDTIIFYYGDHGSGMPRSKRWPYNSGLLVPLAVYVPPKFRDLASDDYSTDGKTDRLVGFIDFAPTLLSLAGINPPAHFQGHAFMGKHEADEQPFIYGFRGRMDERFDMVRTVRDKRYIYIRNYMPHKIYGQYVSYMFQTPTTQVWKRLYDEGKLSTAQSIFWKTKSPEELYDLQADPDEVNNLANSPQHQTALKHLRKAHRKHVLKIRDVGFLPEQEIHSRSTNSTPYEMGHNKSQYPLDQILNMADTASMLKSDPKQMRFLADGLQSNQDTAVRYWAALGLLMRGRPAIEKNRDTLRGALSDESPSVRIIAAEALGRYGNPQDVRLALPVLLDTANVVKYDVFVSMLALNAIDAIDDRAAPIKQQLQQLPKNSPSTPGRMKNYVIRLLEKTLADLDSK